MGAVVISYNLPEVKESLRLSAEVISEIYLGQIVDWSDPKIKALNPGVSLKKRPILVAYRADGSGTTAVFTDYLAKVSPEFLEKVGEGKAVRWPVGVGAKGNEGVSGVIKQTPGALGYIELAYAETNKLGVAHIKNKAGHFVKPSVHTEADKMPADYRVSITNADGKDSYPIAAFTYLLVYQDMPGKKGKELVKFLNWAMKDGQKLAEPMLYSPLPDNLRKRVATTISSIKVQ
jgi:phosphate transport system substrate-binding protein